VEFRDEAGVSMGDTVTVAVFEPGQKVKVAGTSKGKGFQGTIKRHNFASGPKSHGSHNVRAPGSIGASAVAGARDEGHPRPGPDGQQARHPEGPRVVQVDADNNLLLLRGAVPGPRNGIVEVRTDG
jgi:large subunit ribosomal protein L3